MKRHIIKTIAFISRKDVILAKEKEFNAIDLIVQSLNNLMETAPIIAAVAGRRA